MAGQEDSLRYVPKTRVESLAPLRDVVDGDWAADFRETLRAMELEVCDGWLVRKGRADAEHPLRSTDRLAYMQQTAHALATLARMYAETRDELDALAAEIASEDSLWKLLRLYSRCLAFPALADIALSRQDEIRVLMQEHARPGLADEVDREIEQQRRVWYECTCWDCCTDFGEDPCPAAGEICRRLANRCLEPIDRSKRLSEYLCAVMPSLDGVTPPAGEGGEPDEKGYDPEAYVSVKDFRKKWNDLAGGGLGMNDWTKAKRHNPWFRFDPHAPPRRPRLHRADAEAFLDAVKQGRVAEDTFELLNIPGLDLPSITEEAAREVVADAQARYKQEQERKRQGQK